MTISILTLFPELFSGVFDQSIIYRAQKKELVDINLVNIRKFSSDKYKTVDDKPYGGGVGMLLRVDVVHKAISFSLKNYKAKKKGGKIKVILLEPSGKLFTQAKARNLSSSNHLIIVCGHYEGIDHRITNFVDEVISIGQYILTGGEIPAMVIADSVIRLLPGVLKKRQATVEESYSDKNILEAPQYTRPSIYMGLKVPQVLLSGNHQQISRWKRKNSKKITD